MSKLFAFQAEIIDGSGNFIASLPSVNVGVAEADTVDMPTSAQIITGNYTYVTDKINDGLIIGSGSFVTAAAMTGELDIINQYIPLMVPKFQIPSQYVSANAFLKLTNTPSGFYAVSNAPLSLSDHSRGFTAYDAAGNVITSDMPLVEISGREDYAFGFVLIAAGPLETASTVKMVDVILTTQASYLNPKGRVRAVLTYYSEGDRDRLNWLRGLSVSSPTKTVEVTVSWPRPGDGKILSDTFEINVSPASSSGGSSGGTTVDDEGFSGHDGDF